jgi:hypothetical protein
LSQSAVVQTASLMKVSSRSHERPERTACREPPSFDTHTLTVLALTALAPASTDNAVSRASPRRRFVFLMKIPSLDN